MPASHVSTDQVIHLPKAAYTSEEWFKQEQATLFEKNWQFAGLVEDLPEPGDFITVQAGRYSLIVLKGPDGQLRAFHNMCRHRGTQLLRTCGKAGKAITCPYHDWSYSLEGDLIAVPQQKTEFPDLDKKSLGLHKAQVDIWLGMIWVHPMPDAEPLKQWLQGVDNYIGPHRPEALVEYPEAATDHEIHANWKLIVENYIDGYHLAHLHSATLNMYDHQKQKTGFIGPHFTFYEPLQDDYAKNLKDKSPLPPIDHFTDDQPMGAYVPMLFPNLGIAATEDSWSIFHVIPLAPNCTRVITRTRIKAVSDWTYLWQSGKSYSQQSTWSGKYKEGIGSDDPMMSGDFMAEDIYVCEQQQKSLESPLFSVGATARHQEKSIRDFQNIILQQMNASG